MDDERWFPAKVDIPQPAAPQAVTLHWDENVFLVDNVASLPWIFRRRHKYES